MAEYRILIVEDQREISRLLRTALETLEHDLEVVEIPSGEEAILDSSRHPVDLLVADYRLPGMTGIELMRKVKNYQPRLKILLITGQTDPRIRKEVAEAGADGFFIKPVAIADFLDAVERHLGLVETSLPPEPIAAQEEVRHLPDLLSNLRRELEATAVLLVNESGHVVARAGDLPNMNIEVSLISSLLLIYSAGQKISRLVGQDVNSHWSIFDGGEYDLLFAPVGQGHAMLIVGKGLMDGQRAMTALNAFSGTRVPVEIALRQMVGVPNNKKASVPEQEPVPEPPGPVGKEKAEDKGKDEIDEKDEKEELEPLFKGIKRKLKTAELNEFWDQAVDQHKEPIKPDMLTYEQARQLGLAPSDEA